MIMLVQKSRRPRRWAGVALFAALLLAVWWLEQHPSSGDARMIAPEMAAAPLSFEPPAAINPAIAGPSFANESLASHPADLLFGTAMIAPVQDSPR